MATLVVDSSVAIKWYVAEEHAPEAARIRDDAQAGLLTLLAPDIIHSEMGNIVWKKVQRESLADTDALVILRDFLSLPIVITPAASLLEEVYRLAVTDKRSVYDCLYLALAARQNCRFVTADERPVNAVGASLPQAVWLANWTQEASRD